MLVTILVDSLLLLVAAVGALVVFTRDPLKQVIGMSFFGLCLTIFFFLLQAPDVALAQLGVGTVALPMIVLLTMSKLRRREDKRDRGAKG